MAAPGGASSLTCGRCGATRAPEHIYCGACGVRLPAVSPGAPAPPAASQPSAYTSEPRADALPYYISPNRIVLMTFLTAGLYIFYWMYLTWRHYRDHTGETAYPVWHALALAVPIYQFFRLHAHLRVYQELMQARGVPNTLHPLRGVGIYLAVFLLSVAGLQLATSTALTTPQQAVYFGINLAQVALTAWLMVDAQGNLNRYWQHRLGERLAPAAVSPVEILLTIIGLLQWGLVLIVLIDPSLLPTPETAPAPAS